MTPGCAPPDVVVAALMEDADADPACLYADGDVHGRGFVAVPEDGLSRGLALQRARGELGVRAVDAQVRIAVIAVRSGGAEGYTGIDGEAVVPALQIAEGRYDWRATGAAVAAGLIDDPWVMTLQAPYGAVALAPPMVTDQGWMDRSDVGGWLGWTAPGGLLSVTAAATSGEGARARERNTGTNVTGVAHLRPLAGLEDAPVQLELAVMGRDGSRGVDQARDHRAGAAVIVTHRLVVGGVDGMLGWGLDGDGGLQPAGVSLWARGGEALPVTALARVDVATDALGAPDAGEQLLMVAAGPRFPLKGELRPVTVAAGWQGRRYGIDAAPLAGAEALVGTDLFFLQVGVHLRGGITP
ncbi:MAG: hypothetical protein H6736_22275 [Alphaproteobacteria bacterium]|nr:hypothetical protein [Alphaproteobacteria bacterium]MCB9694545.1 hypothetical protein [Alphaproteobacteria bacterium]